LEGDEGAIAPHWTFFKIYITVAPRISKERGTADDGGYKSAASSSSFVNDIKL